MASYQNTTELAPNLPYARIVRTRGRTLDYQLTPEDVHWAAKMAAYEGDPAHVLWAMTQRFVLTFPGQRWNSFAEFIREFSQPINPDWYRGGKYCSPGGKGHRSVACSEEKLDRRAQLEAMDWLELANERARATEITLKWAQGLLPNPVPKAVNFAAPARAQQYTERNPDAQIIARENNWFISEMGTHRWHPNTVVMRQPEIGTVARAVPEKGDNLRAFVRSFINPVGSFGRRVV